MKKVTCLPGRFGSNKEASRTFVRKEIPVGGNGNERRFGERKTFKNLVKFQS